MSITSHNSLVLDFSQPDTQLNTDEIQVTYTSSNHFPPMLKLKIDLKYIILKTPPMKLLPLSRTLSELNPRVRMLSFDLNDAFLNQITKLDKFLSESKVHIPHLSRNLTYSSIIQQSKVDVNSNNSNITNRKYLKFMCESPQIIALDGSSITIDMVPDSAICELELIVRPIFIVSRINRYCAGLFANKILVKSVPPQVPNIISRSPNVAVTNSSTVYRSPTCLICTENESTVIYNCGHQIICAGCDNRIDACPICRTNIRSRLNVRQI